MSDYCTECGMPVIEGEFHPYAACLMFMGCQDTKVVRANLAQFTEYKQRAEAAEAKLRELEMQEPVAYTWPSYGIELFEYKTTSMFEEQSIDAPIPLYAKPFPAPKQEEK